MDKLILPHVRLVPIVEIVSPIDSFSTGKRCTYAPPQRAACCPKHAMAAIE